MRPMPTTIGSCARRGGASDSLIGR
jgi:hypothetical protein